jgi:hypothetical protein
MTLQDWNERYIDGNLPWDINDPDENLLKLVESGIVFPGRALELPRHGFAWHGNEKSLHSHLPGLETDDIFDAFQKDLETRI